MRSARTPRGRRGAALALLLLAPLGVTAQPTPVADTLTAAVDSTRDVFDGRTVLQPRTPLGRFATVALVRDAMEIAGGLQLIWQCAPYQPCHHQDRVLLQVLLVVRGRGAVPGLADAAIGFRRQLAEGTGLQWVVTDSAGATRRGRIQEPCVEPVERSRTRGTAWEAQASCFLPAADFLAALPTAFEVRTRMGEREASHTDNTQALRAFQIARRDLVLRRAPRTGAGR